MSPNLICDFAHIFGSYSQIVALVIVLSSMMYLVVTRLALTDTDSKGSTLKTNFVTAMISLVDIMLLPAMVGPGVTGCTF
jgi:hypothetical protein